MNAIRADYKAKGGEVVILDAGDEFQGTLISNEFRGKSVTDVYNAVGVTAGAIGNHEFDFTVPVLKERMAQSKFPILAANYQFSDPNDPRLHEIADLTPEGVWWLAPSSTNSLRFIENALGELANVVESADAAPTADARASWAKLKLAADTVLARWREYLKSLS